MELLEEVKNVAESWALSAMGTARFSEPIRTIRNGKQALILRVFFRCESAAGGDGTSAVQNRPMQLLPLADGTNPPAKLADGTAVSKALYCVRDANLTPTLASDVVAGAAPADASDYMDVCNFDDTNNVFIPLSEYITNRFNNGGTAYTAGTFHIDRYQFIG